MTENQQIQVQLCAHCPFHRVTVAGAMRINEKDSFQSDQRTCSVFAGCSRLL